MAIREVRKARQHAGVQAFPAHGVPYSGDTPLRLDVATSGARLEATLVPWDTDALGLAVAEIRNLEIGTGHVPEAMSRALRDWLVDNDVRIASCRLAQDRLRESMFLERLGFRFIETVLHPYADDLSALDLPSDTLTVSPAQESDLPLLEAVAARAFGHDRYHIDPRLDPELGNRRYASWVRASLHHPRQRLLKICDGDDVVAFSIVEATPDGGVYRHLTAVVPEKQGRGYGLRTWQAMLRQDRDSGVRHVSTTISARNLRVLNLYVRLGFRFRSPEMTFQWVRGAE